MADMTFAKLVECSSHYLARQLLYTKRCFGGHATIGVVVSGIETDYCGTMEELVKFGHIPSGFEWMDPFLPAIPPVSRVPMDNVILYPLKYQDGGPECPWDTARHQQEEARARVKQSRLKDKN